MGDITRIIIICLIFYFFSSMIEGLTNADVDYSGTYKNEKNNKNFFTLQKTNTYIMKDENNKEKGMVRVKKIDEKIELFAVTIFGETKIGEIIDGKIVMDKDNSVYKK